MTLLAVFVIMYKLAYCNNSSYIPLLVAVYLYSAEAKVDALTLLNHLCLFLLYNLLLKKPKDIKAHSAAFIK